MKVCAKIVHSSKGKWISPTGATKPRKSSQFVCAHRILPVQFHHIEKSPLECVTLQWCVKRSHEVMRKDGTVPQGVIHSFPDEQLSD